MKSHRFFPFWNIYETNQVIGFLDMINYILSCRPIIENYLEIGSMIGESATMVLGFPQIKNIYCVDIWKNIEYKTIFDNRLSNTRCKSIHASSEEASSMIAFPLDIVYIDGDHSYNSVILDLKLWYPKIISGGFICGHDYSISWSGCKQAIDEFILQNNLELILFQDSSWLAKKS